MAKVFQAFDFDQDGFLDMEELKRAFRAMGLKRRSGEKLEVDEQMFKSFDTNGDGKVSLEEFEANLKPHTRAKIEEKIASGWKFEPALWAAEMFKSFDTNGDGKVSLEEFDAGLKPKTRAKIE